MRTCVWALIAPLLGSALLVAATASAQPLAGSAELTGDGILRVKGCGRDPASAAVRITVAADGAWTAQSPEVGFAGTSVPLGASGRKLDLTFDPVSLAGFVAGLASDAAELCEGPITDVSAEKLRFLLQVNRRHTRAKLKVRYFLRGTGPGGPGTATYKLALKGPWTPG